MIEFFEDIFQEWVAGSGVIGEACVGFHHERIGIEEIRFDMDEGVAQEGPFIGEFLDLEVFVRVVKLEGLEGISDAIPGGEVEPGLVPAEYPGDCAQVGEGAFAGTA